MDRARAGRILSIAAQAAAAGAVLAIAVASASGEARHIEFNPVNGHFQNFNAEARLLAGQRPFVDFPAYLGSAALLLPFPLFAAMGGTLAASNAAYDAVCVALLAASLFLAMRLCRWPPAVAAAWAAALSALPWPMARGSDSAIGIRSFAPFAAAAALLGLAALRRRGWPPAALAAAAGCAAGLLPLWSNDYGIPSSAALSLAYLVAFDAGPSRLRAWAAFAASAAASFWAGAAAVTGGHPGAWIDFNLGGVLADQFWYYNPVADNKVYGLGDIPHGPWTWAMVLPNAAAFLFWAAARRRDPRAAALACLCLAACGGAFLSGLAGTYEPRYFMPLWRLTAVTLPSCAAIAAAAFLGRGGRARLRGGDPGIQIPLVAAAVAVGAWCACVTAEGYWKSALATDVAAPELGGSVRPSYAPALEEGRRLRAAYDAAGLPPDRRLLSTYATATALAAGSMQPGPDYVIHALGDKARADFAAALSGPFRNAETINPEVVVWGLWNVRTSWPFYRSLFREWSPSSSTPWSIIWERAPVPRLPGRDLACVVSGPSADGFWELSVAPGEEPPAEQQWVEVRAPVAASFRPTAMPIAGTHRLLELVEGRDPASGQGGGLRGQGEHLAIISSSWTARLEDGPIAVPLRWGQGIRPTISLRAWPLDRASVSVGPCSASVVASRAETQPASAPARGGDVELLPFPAPLRHEPYPPRAGARAFLLRTRDPLDTLRLAPGDRVVFPGGEESVVLLRHFQDFLVDRPPGMEIGYEVGSVRVVPRPAPGAAP